MMFEFIFLSVLAIIWLVFAVVQDLRMREIANWLNFSLIIFALGFRFFYSLFSLGNFQFFYQGLIGLGIFFVLGNLFYYGKLFAGGDAKLMIALGVVLPFSSNFSSNLEIFINFLLIFLFVGAIYSLLISFFISLKNIKKFKKEFGKQIRKNKKMIYLLLFLGLVFMVLGFVETLFFFLGLLIFVLPYFYFYAKAVDESSMIKNIETNKLTEGDWLYRDVRLGNNVIKAKWEGLKKKEIIAIRKQRKKILIRYGMPFSPVFLISFVILIYFWKTGFLDFLF